MDLDEPLGASRERLPMVGKNLKKTVKENSYSEQC